MQEEKIKEYYKDLFCACGCGCNIMISSCHKYSGIPKYIRGHSSKCRKHSSETKEKIRKSLVGHSVSEITKRKIGDSTRGKVFSKEEKERKGYYRRAKKRWSNPEEREKHGLKMKEVSSRPEMIECRTLNMIKRWRNPNTRKIMLEVNYWFNNDMTGENSMQWKGGLSKLPYPFDFNEYLKIGIRERDNHTCQLCGRTKKEEGKNLAVHHIDYVKENLDPKNLITLCCSCNSKVNFGRENWIIFLQRKLKLKVKGQMCG